MNKKLKYSAILAIGAFSITAFANKWVNNATKDYLYNNSNNIPHNKVGLVLGTSKYLADGRLNYYYKYRIDAAVALYKAGKIDYILVSGDNGSKQYDEPTEMRNDLLKEGIPLGKIFLDYAGFRTLDSVLRSKHIFGQSSITVISQPFHNARAVFIARHKNINAIGFNAKDINKKAGFKTLMREKLARVKMLLDLATNKKPKYYGEPVIIN